MREDRLEALLRDRHGPDEDAAQARAWRVVSAAMAEREPAAQPRMRPLRHPATAIAALALLVAVAFTPPGEAVADWVRAVVKPGRENAQKSLVSLPAPGRLLVSSAQGPWIVGESGSKRLLGAYESASWSPRGLFVVATRGRQLVALDPKGRVRWSLARPDRVRGAVWSPDGFRIAYLTAGTARVVAGDGAGDRLLASSAGGTPPAWRPGPGTARAVALSDRAGRVRLLDADSRRTLWRSARGGAPTQLLWSPDGSRLMALAPTSLRLLDAGGALLADVDMPIGTRAEAAAFARSSHSFALVSRVPALGRSQVVLGRLAKGVSWERRIFSGLGRFTGVEWSPDGRWLLVPWADADQWLFIRTAADGSGGVDKLLAVSNIAAQFDPGGAGQPIFPSLGGWCCAPHP